MKKMISGPIKTEDVEYYTGLKADELVSMFENQMNVPVINGARKKIYIHTNSENVAHSEVGVSDDVIVINVKKGSFGQVLVEKINDNMFICYVENFDKKEDMLAVYVCTWMILSNLSNDTCSDNKDKRYYEKNRITFGLEEVALGDAITSFPALYELAKSQPLSVWFDLRQLFDLWAGPPIEVAEHRPEKLFNILEVAPYFGNCGLHMMQGWYRCLGLSIPEQLPKIELAGHGPHDKEVFDVIISPYSASGTAGGEGGLYKIWPYENWNKVIDALLGFGLSVAICGVFTKNDPRNKDVMFWGDRPVAVLDGLPLAELVGYLRGARCVATIDNGIGHLTHLLRAPHAHFIFAPGPNPLFWANRNANAVWLCEPFRPEFGEFGHALQPERVLEAIFAVLGSFDPIAYVNFHPDLVAANAPGWRHWVEYGEKENRWRGYIPQKLHFGSLWRD